MLLLLRFRKEFSSPMNSRRQPVGRFNGELYPSTSSLRYQQPRFPNLELKQIHARKGEILLYSVADTLGKFDVISVLVHCVIITFRE